MLKAIVTNESKSLPIADFEKNLPNSLTMYVSWDTEALHMTNRRTDNRQWQRYPSYNIVKWNTMFISYGCCRPNRIRSKQWKTAAVSTVASTDLRQDREKDHVSCPGGRTMVDSPGGRRRPSVAETSVQTAKSSKTEERRSLEWRMTAAGVVEGGTPTRQCRSASTRWLEWCSAVWAARTRTATHPTLRVRPDPTASTKHWFHQTLRSRRSDVHTEVDWLRPGRV